MRGKWTPGPWFRDCTDEVCATLEGGAVVVIAAFNPMAELNAEATEANACLGAAAPALYEALDELNKTIGGYMLTKGEDRLRYHAQLKGPVAAKVHAALSQALPPKGDEL